MTLTTNSILFLTLGVVTSIVSIAIYETYDNEGRSNEIISTGTGLEYIDRFNSGTGHNNKGAYFPTTVLRNLMRRHNGVIIYYGYDSVPNTYPLIARASNGDAKQFNDVDPESICLSRAYYALRDTFTNKPVDLINAFIAEHNNTRPGVFFSKAAVDSLLKDNDKGVVFYYAAEGNGNPLIMTRALTLDHPVDPVLYGRFLVSTTYCPVCCGSL